MNKFAHRMSDGRVLPLFVRSMDKNGKLVIGYEDDGKFIEVTIRNGFLEDDSIVVVDERGIEQ